MDPPPEYLNNAEPDYQQRPAQRRSKGRQQQPQEDFYGGTQLFDDTSGYQDPVMNQQQPPQQGATPTMFPGQQFIADPMMANMAMSYGQQFANTGKDMIDKKIDHFLSVSRLKYYFAVDTQYVVKKLGLLLFPFAHQDWSQKYDKSEPVPPRYEINAPDLYIPSMAFVTYVLVCGLVLGTQNRFTPEQLGMTASSAMVWLVIELIAIVFTTYVLGISSGVRYLDLMALCGYKYVGMILAALGALILGSSAYYLVLLWCSFSISFYLARTLRLLISSDGTGDGVARPGGAKRRLYMLLFISLMQPLFMYFLTRHLNGVTEVLKKAAGS